MNYYSNLTSNSKKCFLLENCLSVLVDTGNLNFQKKPIFEI